MIKAKVTKDVINAARSVVSAAKKPMTNVRTGLRGSFRSFFEVDSYSRYKYISIKDMKNRSKYKLPTAALAQAGCATTSALKIIAGNIPPVFLRTIEKGINTIDMKLRAFKKASTCSGLKNKLKNASG